jgi:chromosome segregation ATPase
MVDDHKSQVAAWRKRRDQDETARQAFEEELEKVRHDHKQVMIERNDMKQQLEDTTKTLNRSKTETTDLVMALKKADETMRRLEQERPNNNEGLQLECDRRQAELLKVLHLKDELHQQVLDFKKAHELLWAGTQDADRERVKWFKTAEKLQAQVIDLESKLEQEKKVYIESFNANREFRADTRKQLAVMDQKMDMLADNTFALAKQRDDLLHQLEQEQQVVKHLQESVESMVVTHDKTCNLLRASKDEAQKMLENAKARITELEVAHAEVQKQLDDAKARITELEATQVTAQKWADDAIARASQFEGRVKELQHECEEAKKESKDLVDYLQGRITNLQAAWSESDLQNEGLRGKLQAMEDDLDIAKANRTEAVGKMEAARAHTQELEEKLRKSQEEATSLGDGAQHIIAEYKAAKEEMKLHLDEANKNVDYWTTQALEARKRLREYEQKFDSRVDELTRQLEELKQSTEEKVEEIQRRCAEEVMVLVKKHWFTPAAEPCRIDDLAVVLPENSKHDSLFFVYVCFPEADFEAHGYWIGRVTELSYHKGKNIPHAFRVFFWVRVYGKLMCRWHGTKRTRMAMVTT